MNGFFNRDRIQVPYKSKGGVHSCVSCKLYKSATFPKIEPYGQGKKRIMVIGEAPGEEEDRIGKPWQGRAGQALERKFRELGVDLFEDCISLNAVNCRPTDKSGNRAPTDHEIACCRQRVIGAIRQYKPRLILLLGGPAIASLIGYKWKNDLGGITRWRGWTIPDRDFHAWVCPTFHPSFLIRQEEQNEVDAIWTKDLERAFDKLEEPFPDSGIASEEESIIFAQDMEEIMERFDSPGLMAFDIEATGLKPYDRTKHRIVSISFCNHYDYAYVIPFPTKPKHLRMLKQLLENPTIGKIAANMKYEDNWLNVLHDIRVSPWAFDTMQAAHILDNRPGITGLKFQAYVRFGVIGYDEQVDPYLKAKSPNEVNRIMELVNSPEGFRKLMLYNGIDSLMEYRLTMKQMEELGIQG